MKRTATEIINEIADFYGFTKDREVAGKLGISGAVVANWKRRDSVDIFLIADTCPDLDINKLLRRKPLETESKDVELIPHHGKKAEEPPIEYKHFQNSDIFQIIKDKDRTIINLAKQLGEAELKYKELKKQIVQDKQ
uniref:helix-turn-helix domain-containing protein n=1 Tax=uncultured Draconibacterium sp. TaxID=1573823 RepID=UPI003216BBB7